LRSSVIIFSNSVQIRLEAMALNYINSLALYCAFIFLCSACY